MPNTIVKTGITVDITDIDSSWYFTTTFPTATSLFVQSIQFNPIQAADKCVIREAMAIVTAGYFVVGAEYRILVAGTTNFTLIGAANSNVGTKFTATGIGTGTGTATLLGPEIFNALCADAYDQKIKYFHGENKKPFLDFAEGVYTAGTRVIIELSEFSG